MPHHIPQPPRSDLIVPLDQRHFAQHDANFNITSITDANGQVAERYLYTAYGEVTAADGAWYGLSGTQFGMRYFFQGGRYQADAATYNFRNRDYSPALGRWMSADPLGYPDGANRYQGFGSNPVGLVDPTGADPETKTMQIPRVTDAFLLDLCNQIEAEVYYSLEVLSKGALPPHSVGTDDTYDHNFMGMLLRNMTGMGEYEFAYSYFPYKSTMDKILDWSILHRMKQQGFYNEGWTSTGTLLKWTATAHFAMETAKRRQRTSVSEARIRADANGCAMLVMVGVVQPEIEIKKWDADLIMRLGVKTELNADSAGALNKKIAAKIVVQAGKAAAKKTVTALDWLTDVLNVLDKDKVTVNSFRAENARNQEYQWVPDPARKPRAFMVEVPLGVLLGS